MEISTIQQRWAIESTIDAARNLQSEVKSSVLNSRRSIKSYSVVAEECNLMALSGLSEKCMHSLVHHVLLGYEGRNPFGGIISKGENNKIRSEILRVNYNNSLGKLSKEKKVENASIAGMASYEKGVGIHGRSSEAVRRDSCLGGKNSVEARGMISWEDGERLALYILDKSGVYNREELAGTVNDLWGNNRSPNSVRVELSRFRKSYSGLENLS